MQYKCCDILARFAIQVKILSNKTFDQTGSRLISMHMITSSVLHFCGHDIRKLNADIFTLAPSASAFVQFVPDNGQIIF